MIATSPQLKLVKPRIIATTLMVLSFGLNTSVAAKTPISEGTRQGVTWKTYLLNTNYVKPIVRGEETRRIYLANTETHNSSSGISRRTDLLQCSTSEPFVSFNITESGRGITIVHYINPGGDSGAFPASHNLYWAVCHQVYEPWKRDLVTQAKQLGYSLNLTERQTKIPHRRSETR